MTPSSKNPATTRGLVCVVDTSALIEIKRIVSIDKQWVLLTGMMKLVDEGSLCFPRQVAAEMQGVKFPDAPGAWVAHARNRVCYSQPLEETQVRVLLVAEQLVEVDAPIDREVADPYVAAMALELSERYPDSRVVVATNDFIDRLPVKLSLAEACKRLDIEYWKPGEFVAWVEQSL